MPGTITRERTLRRRQERAAKKISEDRRQTRSPRPAFLLGLVLVAITLALYSPVRRHDFINFDDDVYVYKNPHVISGLSWPAAWWALSTKEQANWHPVTWLSHELDCEWFGLDPGWHHITNLLFHVLNAWLLFILLERATGATLASFFVAALFAWHPFNVGSVAWIAERKNLLSTFFFLLTLSGYGWYLKKPGTLRLLTVAGLFLVALGSKPMAVTLPFLLLLIDYWPLGRISGWTNPSLHFPAPQAPFPKLLWEKWPFFVLSAASSVVTFLVQRSGGAVQSFQRFPLSVRLENALYAYLVYIRKTFWPSGFALHYPHPGASLAFWKPALSAIILVAASLAIWNQRRARPYLAVGWLWFLGALVPVIGIVQVGDQAMADRYAYLPLIGLFLMTVWTLKEFSAGRMGFVPRAAAGSAVLAILITLSARELSYWQDSVSIWSHTLEVTRDNLEAERGIATALAVAGNTNAAIPHFLNVVRLDPGDLSSRVNVGAYYAANHRLEDAVQQFRSAIERSDNRPLSPDDQRYRSSAFLDLGFAYVLLKNYPAALTNFREANRSGSDMVAKVTQSLDESVSRTASEQEYLKLALLELAQGKNGEALATLKQAGAEGAGALETERVLGLLKDGSPQGSVN